MARYPDKFFELAIVDPPYGIGEDGSKNHTRGCKVKFGGKMSQYGSKVHAKNYKAFSGNDKSAPDRMFFAELRRVSRNQIVWGANHFISRIPYDSPAWVIWDKMNGDSDFADCELAWTSFETAARKVNLKWNGMLQHDMRNKEMRIHPTQKPIALYKWLLQNYAKPGDKILDTHLGSGSSRVAAYDMGFDFYGWELDSDYFNAMQKRFDAHASRPALFSPEQMYNFEQVKLFE